MYINVYDGHWIFVQILVNFFRFHFGSSCYEISEYGCLIHCQILCNFDWLDAGGQFDEGCVEESHKVVDDAVESEVDKMFNITSLV